MKHKTSELTWALLDAAVISALGMTVEDAAGVGLGCPDWRQRFRPSSSWAHGGPIIERERIAVVENGAGFDAFVRAGYYGPDGQVESPVKCGESEGPTYLIAAMRAFVASRLGDEVDIP